MSQFIDKEQSLLISSNPSLGAKSISSNGARFSVLLDQKLGIPKKAIDVSVEVIKSEIWWTIPNIITGVNDKFYYDDNGTPYEATIPQGLYDAAGLNNALQTQLVNLGLDSGQVVLTADFNTQKMKITVSVDNQEIDFTQSDTFRDIIGFDSQTLSNGGTSPFTWLADNTAAFNTINYFMVHGTITDNGIPLNNNNSYILAKIQIDVKPGSQITYAPFNPTKTPANGLKGEVTKRFTFWLTDDEDNLVNTNNEYWSAELRLRYKMPVEKKS